ncbi:MAG: hypothetical protein ACLRR3_11970 [Eubacterium sp.]
MTQAEHCHADKKAVVPSQNITKSQANVLAAKSCIQTSLAEKDSNKICRAFTKLYFIVLIQTYPANSIFCGNKARASARKSGNNNTIY